MKAVDDFDFILHMLLHGAFPRDHKMQIGEIPEPVAWAMAWKVRHVFLSACDAEKIRFHPDHGLDGVAARKILHTIEHGDYYRQFDRGSVGQVTAVLHNPSLPRECHFLVLDLDCAGRGIFIRTFYRSSNFSRSKFRRARRLLHQSGIDYFKGM